MLEIHVMFKCPYDDYNDQTMVEIGEEVTCDYCERKFISKVVFTEVEESNG